MSWKNVLSILAVSAVVAMPLQSLGDNDRNGRAGGHDKHERDRQAKKAAKDAQYREQLIARYSVLSGSGVYATPNATSLVEGVHKGRPVTLKRKMLVTPSSAQTTSGSCGRFACPSQPPVPVEQEVTLTFEVPTGAMKYKQVAIALALMEAKLESLDRSTKIVTATPTQINDVLVGVPSGILTMRASKKNWVQIARSLDLTVADFRQVKNDKGDDDDEDDDD